MTESSGFYDPGGYDSATIAKSFARNLGNGVIAGELNALEVAASTPAAMSVDIETGGARIQGYDYYNSAVVTKTIEAADVTHPRIDRIIVRNTATGSPGAAIIVVLKGTAATPATAPSLTRSSTVYDISLAQVSIPVGTTSISASNITDERASDTVCGWARPASVGKIAYTTVDMNSFRITNLAAPLSASDAATLSSITGTKLDDLTTPDDNTDLNFSSARHGLCPKGGVLGYFLRDDGVWSAVATFKTASASDTIKKASDAVVNGSGTAAALKNSINIPANYNAGSIFRIKFDIAASAATTGYAYLTANGVVIGAVKSVTSETYTTFSQDLAVTGNTVLGLWLYNISSMGTTYAMNFRVYCTDTIVTPEW